MSENEKNLVVKIPSLPDRRSSRESINLYAANRTYMYKLIKEQGLASFESEALGISAALIEEFNIEEFADIGANIGVFSWSMKAIFGDKLKVTSYEPLPTLFRVLQMVYAHNEIDIELERVALATKNGTAKLYVSTKTDSSNSLNQKFRNSKYEVQVDTRRMTTSFGEKKPLMIKIDTESTEPDVLEGGKEYISEERPFLIIEVLANRTEQALTDFCAAHNYSAYKLDGMPLEPALKIQGDREYKYRDWLFAPSEIDFTPKFSKRYQQWVQAFSSE